MEQHQVVNVLVFSLDQFKLWLKHSNGEIYMQTWKNNLLLFFFRVECNILVDECYANVVIALQPLNITIVSYCKLNQQIWDGMKFSLFV